MPNWKKVIVSGSDAILNDVTIDGTLSIPGFSNLSSSLASLEVSKITNADLVYTSSGVENSSQPTHITNIDESLKVIATGSRSVVLNASKNLPNIISGSHGQYAAEVIVNGISNVIRQTGAEASTVQNTSVAILNGSSNLISSSVDSSILAGTNNKIHNGRHSIIGGGNSNCLIGDFYSGGSCVLVGNSIVGGQHNRISGSSNAGNTNWWNTIGGGEYNKLYQTGCSIIGAGHHNRILGNSATFDNSNKTYKENSIVAGKCNDIIDERNSHIIGGAYNKIIGDSTQNTTLQGSGNIIGAGHCNVITGSCYSAILGGKDNCLEQDDSFIIGSCITSSANCTTFVNNLCVYGNAGAGGTITATTGIFGTGTTTINDSISSTGNIELTGSIYAKTDITASGNISSSGYISASFFSGDGSQLKNLPSSGGSVFETGSAPQNTPSLKPIAGLNTASGNFSSVLGGKCNVITNEYSFIGGGKQNLTSGSYSNVVGGFQNQIIDGYGTTDGGATFESLPSNFSSIAGGMCNQISSPVSNIIGGCNNIIKNSCYSTIGGGLSNCINVNATSTNYNYIDVNTISGGKNNLISGSGDSHIAGGDNNKICIKKGVSNTIHGGYGNSIIGGYSTYSNIAGGGYNEIQASYCSFSGILGTYNASILSGYSNKIISENCYINQTLIVGGQNNCIKGSSAFSTIVGGLFQKISSSRSSTVVGGGSNCIISSSYGIIGGGSNNLINNENLSPSLNQGSFNPNSSAILGGYNNSVTNAYSLIGGGKCNIVSSSFSIIGGGRNNVISGSNVEAGTCGCFQTIVGGENNSVTANTSHNFIGGGRNNKLKPAPYFTGVSGTYSNIVGGKDNTIVVGDDSNYHSIMGGRNNCIEGDNYASFIGGGIGNRIAGGDSSKTIVGGEFNYNSGRYATIGGGYNNCVTGYYSTLVGGYYNCAKGSSDTISGGCHNSTRGEGSTIAGGLCNIIFKCNFNLSANTIAGGYGNHIIGEGTVSGDHAHNTILGGYCNNISASVLAEGSMNVCNNIIGGQNNKIHNTQDSGILGGKSNCITHNNSFIVGSDICTTRTDTLFVNNICLYGSDGSNGQILGGANIVLEEGTFGTATTIINDNISSSGYLKMEGAITASTDISSSGTIQGNHLRSNSLTSGNVVLAGTNGRLDDTTDFTYNTSNKLLSAPTASFDHLIVSQVISSSVINTSGSNIFGDEATDIQTLNGSVILGNTSTDNSQTTALFINGSNTLTKRTLQANAFTNTSIPTAVTDLSDVTSAGSGIIITAAERTAIGTNTSGISTNTSNIASNASQISTNVSNISGKLTKSSNLSDLTNTTTARTNLGLGNVDNKSSSTIRGEITSANVTTALGFTPTANTGTITSVTGTAPIASSGGTTPAISISAATNSTAGSMSATDKGKIDAITVTSGVNLNTMNSSISSNTTAISGKAASGANTDITSIINSSLTTIGSNNSETTENYINFGAGKIALTQGLNLVVHAGADFRPGTTNSMNLGTSAYMWADTYSRQFISDASTTSTPAFVIDKDETNTGFYYKGTNQLAVTVGGNEIGYFNASGLQVTKTSATSQFSGHLQAHCLGIGTSPSTVSGEIRATGDIVANYSSDKRLKTNIKPISGALDKLLQISGVTFDWIEKEEIHSHKGHDVGVIAQEVEAVLPEVVVTRDNGYKAVNYEKIVPLLIESIKDLKAEIDELKKSK